MIYYRGLGILALEYGLLAFFITRFTAQTVTQDPQFFQDNLSFMFLCICLIAGILSYITGLICNKRERQLWREDARIKKLYPNDKEKYKSIIPTGGKHSLMGYNLEHWLGVYIFIYLLGSAAGHFL